MVKSPRTAGYSLLDFAKSLRIDGCRVENRPGLIFLCGGPVATSGPYLSARDYFHRRLLRSSQWKDRIKLAEDVSRWFKRAWFRNETTFSDLLEVENHLAELSAVTILFVESPGSIAELGAFAASDSIRPKTLAVLNDIHGVDNSFIADGPVRRLENGNREHVHFYRWDQSKPNAPSSRRTFGEISDELIAYLERHDKAQPRAGEFRVDNLGHILLLVTEFVHVSGVLNRSDLVSCLEAVGLETSGAEVSRHLAILESVGLVGRRRRQTETFYVPSARGPYLRHAYNEEAQHKDLASIQLAVRQSFDHRRRSILTDILRQGKHDV